MTTKRKLLSALLLLGLPVGCSFEDAPDVATTMDEDAALTRSTVLTTGEHEFLVHVNYGPDVAPEQVESLIENMVIVPRAEAFPDLDAAQLEALEGASRHAQPLDADALDVVLEPLDAEVSASDYAWRSVVEWTQTDDPMTSTPRLDDEPEGELGTASEALSFGAVLTDGKTTTSRTVNCLAANFSWLLITGSGSFNFDDLTSDTSEKKSALAFPPTMGAVSIPFAHGYRVRAKAGGNGLAFTGALTCI